MLAACQNGPATDSLIANPLGPFPESFADVGLYPDLSDLTVVTPHDPTGASNPGSVDGTFQTGNSGNGTWWAAHNEDGPIVVWNYDATGVTYRGVDSGSGYSGVMRVGQLVVGTWVEATCP